jgi:DNA processing protein
MPKENLRYQIAITLISGIGDIVGKKLISYCGGVEAVFKQSRRALLKIPGIGITTVNNILEQNVLRRAEQEIDFIIKNNVRTLFYKDADYPVRLLNCDDSPIMLYYKGNCDLNRNRIISFVGTRKSTQRGKINCEKFIDDLKTKNVVIVSGLAYGIDSIAHRHAVKEKIDTVAVLGHGLDRIYPYQNRELANRIIENGGLLTEFMSGTNPDKQNFPKRNRIVAGMSDAIVVIESGERGGALITADIANSYNRDVFALPGRITDKYSKGCNVLIKTNKAALAESAKDISYIMSWDDIENKVTVKQRDMFFKFSDEEKLIFDTLNVDVPIGIDKIIANVDLPPSKVSSVLLSLEFEGVVQSLPGKLYTIY